MEYRVGMLLESKWVLDISCIDGSEEYPEKSTIFLITDTQYKQNKLLLLNQESGSYSEWGVTYIEGNFHILDT